MKRPDIKETIEELNTMLHKERDAELKRHIHILVLLKNGEYHKRVKFACRGKAFAIKIDELEGKLHL